MNKNRETPKKKRTFSGEKGKKQKVLENYFTASVCVVKLL